MSKWHSNNNSDTPDDGRVYLPKLTESTCFGCGPSNPKGLQLKMFIRDQQLCAEVVLGEHMNGWQGIAHGGIVATLLDEIIGWAALCSNQCFFVTATLKVRYVRPVPLNEPLLASAPLSPKKDDRRVKGSGKLLLVKDNTLLAKGYADLVRVDPSRFSLTTEYREALTAILEQTVLIGRRA